MGELEELEAFLLKSGRVTQEDLIRIRFISNLEILGIIKEPMVVRLLSYYAYKKQQGWEYGRDYKRN